MKGVKIMRKKIYSTLLRFVSLNFILLLLLGSKNIWNINIPDNIDFGSNGFFCSPLNDEDPMPRDDV